MGARAVDGGRILRALRARIERAETAEDLLDAVCATVHEQLGGGVTIYVEGDDRMWLRAARGFAMATQSYPLDIGFAPVALRERRTVVVESGVTKEPRFMQGVRDTEALVAVPVRGEPPLAIVYERPDALPLGVVEALEEVAEELADALAALPAEAGNALAGSPLATRILRIGSQRNPQALLELTARTLLDTLDLDSAQICEFDGEILQLVMTSVARPGSGLPVEVEVIEQIAADAGNESIVYHAVAGSGRAAGELLRARNIGSALGLPLRAGGDLIGYVLGIRAEDDAFTAAAVEEASVLVAHAGTVLAHTRALERKEHEALTDSLTGLANHRRFHEAGAALIEAAPETGFALVLADLDDFKELNDRRGHVAGDDALRVVARLLRRGMRPDDEAFRVGGEEFALLLPATSLANARTVCRRIQRWLEAEDFGGWRLTLSFGVARWPDDGPALRELSAAADAALYEAKRLGKDRITYADERLVARRSPTMAARTRRSFEHMRRLGDLTRRLVAVRAPAAVCSALLDVLRDVIPHERALIGLRQGDELVPAAGTSDADEPLRALARRVLEEGTSLLVDDLEGGGSAVAVPLEGDDVVRGAVALGATGPAAFDRDDLRLLEVMARVTGLVLDNGALASEAQVGERRARDLLALTRALMLSETVEGVGRLACRFIERRVPCDRVSLWLVDDEARATLIAAAGAHASMVEGRGGYPVRAIARDELVERLMRGEAVTGGPDEMLLIPGVEYPPTSWIADAPVSIDGELVGTLSLYRHAGPPATGDELAVLESVALQTTLALQGLRAVEHVEQTFAATVESLMQALEAKDAYTSEHTADVVALAGETARLMGLDERDQRLVQHAAALHDIGKIGVPTHVLHKTEPLSDEDWELIRRHPELGERIIAPIPGLSGVAPLVRASHERWDGGGYPDGLAGERIPMGARIVAVCDAFDAITTTRSYRVARDEGAAVEELRRCAGEQFDPAVVEAFVEVANRRRK